MTRRSHGRVVAVLLTTILARTPAGAGPLGYVLARDGRLTVFDTDTDEVKKVLPLGSGANLATTSEGRHLYSLGATGVAVVDTAGHFVTEEIPTQAEVLAFAVSPDETRLFLAELFADRFAVRIHDIPSGAERILQRPDLLACSAMVAGPDATRFYAVCVTRDEADLDLLTLVVIDAATARIAASVPIRVLGIALPLQPVLSPRSDLALAPDGRALLVADGTAIHRIDLATNSRTLFADQGAAKVAIADDGRVFAATGDGIVILGPDGAAIGEPIDVPNVSSRLALTADGRKLYVVRVERIPCEGLVPRIFVCTGSFVTVIDTEARRRLPDLPAAGFMPVAVAIGGFCRTSGGCFCSADPDCEDDDSCTIDACDTAVACVNERLTCFAGTACLFEPPLLRECTNRKIDRLASRARDLIKRAARARNAKRARALVTAAARTSRAALGIAVLKLAHATALASIRCASNLIAREVHLLRALRKLDLSACPREPSR